MRSANFIWTYHPVALSDDKKSLIRWDDHDNPPRTYLPLKEETGLFMQFADCDDPHRFAGRYGMLFAGGEPESLERWQQEIANMKLAVDRFRNGQETDALLRSVDLRDVLLQFEGQELALMPRDLRSALWLQLALAIHNKAAFRDCSWCGKPFQVGTKQKNAPRVFCSNSCKQHDYRHRLASLTITPHQAEVSGVVDKESKDAVDKKLDDNAPS